MSLLLLALACASGPAVEVGPVQLARAESPLMVPASDFLSGGEWHVVEVSPSRLRVGGEQLLALSQGRFTEEQRRGQMVSALYEELLDLAEAAKDRGQTSGREEDEFRGRILLVLDERLRFETVRQVMYTAGQAQFREFSFLVQGEPWQGEPAPRARGEACDHTPSLLLGSTGMTLDQEPLPCPGHQCETVEDYDWARLRQEVRGLTRRCPQDEMVVLVPEAEVPFKAMVRAMDLTRFDPSTGHTMLPWLVVAGGGFDQESPWPVRVPARASWTGRLTPDQLLPVFQSTLPAIGPPAPGAPDDAPAKRSKGSFRVARAAEAPPMDLSAVFGTESLSGDTVGGIAGLIGAKGASTFQPAPAKPEPASTPQATRAWFPETFLWQPLITTDPAGQAQVEVRVPDQLTTWRVLALAHDQAGHQAGEVHRFDSTLDLYADPTVPGWLYAGDVVELPVQVVNRRDQPLESRLFLEASGPLTGAGVTSVSLGPGESSVATLRMEARGAGEAEIHVILEGHDAVVRQIPVSPTGRPVRRTVSGTLADQRVLELPPIPGAAPQTERLQVAVYPGSLAVLQAEVERLEAGGEAPPGLGLSLADALPGQDLRPLRLRSWQRLVRAARSPDPGQAADLLLALGQAAGEQESQLRTRLVLTLVRGQRADGTWARQERAPLQQVLVQTALAALALPQDQPQARLRAAGALERFAPEVRDPLTASALLATGLVAHDQPLRELLEEEIELGQGAWGPASRAEVLAWRVLALGPDQTGDEAAELMGLWDPERGFEGGPVDALALRALRLALPALEQPADLSLSRGDQALAHARVDPSQPHVPGLLQASPSAGEGEWTLKAQPTTPGLAWTATRQGWVPWTDADRLEGVEVEASLSALSLGRGGTLRLEIAAPSGAVVTIDQGLPAGAQADLSGVEDRLDRAEAFPDHLHLVTRPFSAGQVLEVEIPVFPSFSGRFSTAPLRVEADGQEALLPPLVWEVRG